MEVGSFAEPQADDGPSWASDECLELTDALEAVRDGRRFVVDRVRTAGIDALADDAALVSAELLANARQHGAPPIVVCVRAAGDAVRIEVKDAGAHGPVLPAPSTSNMTGRGLTLVAALSARWGVRREPGGGKAVWSELVVGHGQDADDSGMAGVLDLWDDDIGTDDQRFTVVLGDVPTELLLEAKAHIDNLVREFSLAAAAGASGDAVVPEHLAQLIETVVNDFTEARVAIKRQALAAAQRGEPRTRLVLNLPHEAAAAGERYLAALDEADEYARAARLLTLETPFDHRMFRRWYVEAVIQQLREIAEGGTATAVPGFEQVLVAEIRSLAASQRVSERAARLQRVTAALARARTPEDVASVVISEGVGALGASGGALLVPAGDGEHLAVPGVVGYGAELVGQFLEERLDAPLPAATALRTGEPVWLESQDERDRLFPTLRGFEASTASMCAVPLLVGERSLGALRFSFARQKLFDDDERDYVLALASLTGQTLLRTELYEAERRTALQLQRALLPGSVGGIPGWDVAAYYSPAGDQEAGGDFYDVIPCGDGSIAAIVGDVMGRGVTAAAAMGQFRSTMRAYAVDDPDPVAVFQRVDAFFAALDVGQLVTVAYMFVGAGSANVRLASAGHLPPILVSDGSARLVEVPRGMPFGVFPDTRTISEIDVPPGGALIIYTDGLVERRDEDIDIGVDRLVAAAARASADTADDLLQQVMRSAAADVQHDDDVTILVLRREP